MVFLNSNETAVGLDVISDEFSNSANLVFVEKDKDGLELVSYQTKVEITELKNLSNHPNVILVLNGTNVVNKVSSEEDYNFDSSKIFRQRNEKGKVGLIRKDKLQEILNELNDLNIFPSKIYIGNHLNDNYEELIELGSEQSLFFGEKQYPKTIHCSLASALSHFINPVGIETEFIEGFEQNNENIRYRRRFIQGLKGASIFFGILFGICLIGMFILSKQKSDSLENSILNRPQLTELKKLDEEIKLKRAILNQNKWTQSSKTSFYIDRLASSIPDGISLNSWNVFDDNSALFEIDGQAKKSSLFNDWITEIKTLDFIDESSVSFQYDEISNLNNKEGLFSLTLKILEDE